MDIGRVATLLVLFCVVALPIAAAQSSATDGVSRTFGTIKPALPKTITENVLGPAGTPVFEMHIDVLRTLVQAGITLKSTTPEEEGLTVTPGGAVYSYMNISAKNIDDSDINEIQIKFRVARSWMTENDIESDSIRMLRLVSDTWEELPTEYLSEDTDYVSYRSTSKGLSIFAIAGQSSAVPVVQMPVETPKEQQPEIIEVGPGEDISQIRGQDNTVWIVAVIIVVVVIVALLFVPGSILHRKSRQRM